MSLPRTDQSFVIGSINTRIGAIPRISSKLTGTDRWGAFKVRWGLRRMSYKVDPGLYALGEPRSDSPVLVTANYKLSFDALRSALPGRSLWILVLDTDGINVWCAAGKGTFSTEELLARIESSGLDKLTEHSQIILPQLCAPGVAAYRIHELSGFKVKYGPIRSKDLPTFIDNNFKATPEMRTKTFPMMERIVLIPVELVEALKGLLLLIPLFLLIGGFVGSAGFWNNVITHGLFAAFALVSAVFAGAVLTPILLPWLPGRAFAIKGAVAGLLVSWIPSILTRVFLHEWPTIVDSISWILIVIALAAFIGMNFTGASTFTSLSGVKREMRWGLPFQIVGATIGLILWFGSNWTI